MCFCIRQYNTDIISLHRELKQRKFVHLLWGIQVVLKNAPWCFDNIIKLLITNLKLKKMKKLFVVAALLSVFAATKAQNVELIPKAGINISTQSIKGLGNEKTRVGIQGGLGVNVHTGITGFSIQPELNFINKGTSLKTTTGREKLNQNYLELPVLAKYSYGLVYVNAGPYIGLRLGEGNKEKLAYGDTKRFDLGVQMGGGLAIPAGPGKVILDARYSLGLNNIAETSGINIKNRGIMVSAGYAITL